MTNDETNLYISSDEPGLSSAALSTTLHLLDESFRPEFTHQCLPEEYYRGHGPLETTITNHPLYDPKSIMHKSHQFHSQASYQLNVEIKLAPSCRKCQVVVHRTRNEKEPCVKKPRQEIEPMTEEEIIKSISKALPSITDETCDDDYLKEPIGTILLEYSQCDHHFVMTLADGPAAADYHSQVQKLALWFIENADDVDVADDQSGFWKIIYLFQKRKEQYSLVGYLTLFHFHAPFHKLSPGIIARICQALVFPPYQGRGHGTKLMECVYDLAMGKHHRSGYSYNSVQVNVEDPSPGFTYMRNIMDYQYLTREDHRSWWPKFPFNTDALLQEDENAFLVLAEHDVLQISTNARITPRQVQLVHELIHLQFVLSKKDDELETKFRLMVKKRLNREYKEDMVDYPTKEEKKAFLARLYDDEIRPYKVWITKRQQQS